MMDKVLKVLAKESKLRFSANYKLQIGQWLINVAVIGLPSCKIRICNIYLSF